MDAINDIHGEILYQPTRLIAAGGMGSVYEGIQHGADDFQKQVAIKVILEKYSKIKEFRNNFVGEAKLVADLIHTNIVQTYHLGITGHQYYMVMEYVNGINLEDFFVKHLELKTKIPVDIAVFIISRVCRGLSYAHNKTNKAGRPLRLVHRDVSPRNIMLAREGDVKLTDFGIAKARDLMYNKEGEVIAGKDEYLSPEQARKEVTDHRADIFSAGIVLSELLLGRNIFEATLPEQTHDNILNAPLPNFTDLDPRIDAKLNIILTRCLQRNRDDRYQTAFDLLTDLELYLYADGYGPTNEKLAVYVNELYSAQDASSLQKWAN